MDFTKSVVWYVILIIIEGVFLFAVNQGKEKKRERLKQQALNTKKALSEISLKLEEILSLADVVNDKASFLINLNTKIVELLEIEKSNRSIIKKYLPNSKLNEIFELNNEMSRIINEVHAKYNGIVPPNMGPELSNRVASIQLRAACEMKEISKVLYG